MDGPSPRTAHLIPPSGVVVEACHSWLNRNRGVLIRWCKTAENHLALLHLASGLTAFKKAHDRTLEAAQVG